MRDALPKKMMQDLREREDLQPDDESKDGMILSRTNAENFTEILEWNGLINHYSLIRHWVETIWQIDLDHCHKHKDLIKQLE